MGQFVYQVRDGKGAGVSGVLVASSLAEAARALRGEGHVILDLREQAGEAQTASAGGNGRRRVRRDEVIFFANQLAVMVDTGVPLPEALDSIAQQTASEDFRLVLTDLSDQVKAGVDFSVALGRYPRIFSRLFVAMVRASEASGTMGRMLQRVSRHLEQQRQIVRRVKGAMAYPLAMIGFCILVLTTIMTFVLPRFERIYADKAAVLPAPTRVLLGLTRGLATYWPHLLAGLVGVSLGVWLFCRRPASRPLLDGLRLRLPVLGKMFRKTCLARALRTLATMISAGVSLLESLEITAAVSGNVHYDRLWRTLAARLKEGRSLAEEMSGQPLLPRSLCQMVAAGERAGKLATVLDRVAGFCEEDLDTSIRTVTSFVEPAMVVIMGGIVGCIALALLLPVFSLSRIMVR